MSAFGTYACFESCMLLVHGCVLFSAVPDIFFKTVLSISIKLLQYRNIIMMSELGRKIYKQIQTHETDAASHKHIILSNMDVKQYS